MAEIFDALQVLNRTQNLGLSGAQLLAAEHAFRAELARRSNFPDALVADSDKLTCEWEMTAYLRPREKPLGLAELEKLANKALKKK